ncbi:MAG TPA: hypothetical protein VF796_05790, partial [Humisphaera sp.]
NATAFVTHLTDTLGPACAASVEGGQLVVKLDAAAAHRDPVAVRRLERVLSTGRAFRPAGGAFGITLHTEVFLDKPMTVLVHGLDSGNEVWGALTQNMVAEGGWQAGFFRYPNDGPIGQSAELLADCLADVRLRYPKLRINLLTHSMGGLVARDYVEGPMYRAGTVGKLVMVCPPNHGSPYTKLRWALEVAEQYNQYRQKGFDCAQMKADGHGEAGAEMACGSEFLKRLNARPRRDGVAYTIIAGDRSAVNNVAADWVDCTAGALGGKLGNVWGIRQTREGLAGKAQNLRAAPADNDGPVPVASTGLDGVADHTIVHADHIGLIVGYPPAAYEVIKARLKK